MRCVVVGAGAWGLSAATELAVRGHAVVLVDRYGVGNALSSSSGPTRLWRLADPDPDRVRLSMRGLEALRRVEEASGTVLHLRRGLLWRDEPSLPSLAEVLKTFDVPFDAVDADDVGRFVPGLAADGRTAVFQRDAGVVLADAYLRAQYSRFRDLGGRLIQAQVDAVECAGLAGRPRVHLADSAVLDADSLVLAAGPGMGALLAGMGVEVELRPYLEQVAHYVDAAGAWRTDEMPCLFDGPSGTNPGVYAMPSPGIGYKLGIDAPLRALRPDDDERGPDPVRSKEIRARARALFPAFDVRLVDEQVCCWTDSPDGRFVIDRIDERVVIACGDSGEGFKYCALMGEVLADLAETRAPDPDLVPFRLDRLAAIAPDPDRQPTALGR